MLEEGETNIRSHSFPPFPFLSIPSFTKYSPLAIVIPHMTIKG